MAESKKLELSGVVINFRSPAVLLRRDFDVMQDSADVNRLAVVTAVVFAESFHAENFTQRRKDAKKFLTRIAQINTNYFLTTDGHGLARMF